MFNVKNMLVQNRSCDKIKERGLITVHPLSWYRQTPYSAHPTNPVECCADANPKTMLPNDT